MSAADATLWPSDRLYELVQRLATGSGLSKTTRDIPSLKIDAQRPDASVKRAARLVAVEAHAATLQYREVAAVLPTLAPAVARIERDGEPLFLGLLRSTRKGATVITPTGQQRHLDQDTLRTLLCCNLETPLDPLVDSVVGLVGVGDEAGRRVRRAVLSRMLGDRTLADIWVLRTWAGVGLVRQILEAGLGHRMVWVSGLYILQSLLMAFSWWLIGKGALSGTLEPGVLIAWAILLVTNVFVLASAGWSQGTLMLGVSGLYKKKMLHGASRLEPEQIRSLGSGQLLGRVMETQSLDALAFTTSVNIVMALVDLVLVLGLFLLIPGTALLMSLYLLWVGFIALRGWQLYRRIRDWARTRIGMTHNIVEGLLGHRTRVVQEDRSHWHAREDRELARYLEDSEGLDRARLSYEVITRQGWLVLALLALLPGLVTSAASTGWIAAVLGSILLSFRALTWLSETFQSLASLAVSWEQAKVLYQTPQRPRLEGLPEIVEMEQAARSQRGEGKVVLEADDLRFGYASRVQAVVENASITVRRGDRVLLEGPSGCGKSTLASLLCGLLTPSSGLLLLDGFDIKALGQEEWARRVAYVPQFKENHIFTGTLAYNLLMGRRWPATAEDLAEAGRVCRELGLGPLLDKMPASIHQVVGETGWKLSHGEQSRIFLARALLQEADAVILDESFGALDPATLKECLRVVLERAPTLITIAHP
jgi:ATP-binding cassette subfamily B protein